METSKIISRIKGAFQGTLTTGDGRCKVQSLDFITALICSIATKNGRVKNLSALRQSIMAFTHETLSRGTFWERLATKKSVKLLQTLLSTLMNDLCIHLKIGCEILAALGVNKILLLDSSSFSLPDGSKDDFPAPRNNVVPAALKIHVLHDLFGGATNWFDITPATTHDRKGFPPLALLTGALIIFDLGYWDFQLLKDMMDGAIFFLSRVKSNARIKIVEAVTGVSKTCIGFDLNSARLSSFRGNVVEVIGEFVIQKTKESFQSRIIGFWSTDDSSYHWYVTNLKVSSDLIYPLYRLRWQLELIWKSWKSFFHMDEISSKNRNIILSLTLIGMCAGLLSVSVSISVLNNESNEKQAAISVQRGASLFLRIGELLFNFIKGGVRGAKDRLMKMVILFKDELYDPNYNNRTSSVRRICDAIVKLE